MSLINKTSGISPEGKIWKKLDQADGNTDGIVTKKGVENIGSDKLELIKNLPAKDQQMLGMLSEGKADKIQLIFSDGHDNDVTILSASRMGENAIPWLSPSIIKNWKPGQTLDSVIKEVSNLEQTGMIPHQPTLFISKDEHTSINNHYSLIFANSDYNANNSLADRNDLPSIKTEGKNLLEAYKNHDYQTTLYEDSNDNFIKEKVSGGIKQASPGDELVVHYSGHGSQDGITGVHNKIFSGFDTLYNSEIHDLVRQAREKGVKLVFIVDSCQSGFTTDYVRHYQAKGLEKLINGNKENKDLNNNEKQIISSAGKNLESVKNLLNEIDKLHDKPLEIKINDKTNKIKLEDYQKFLKEKYEEILPKSLYTFYSDDIIALNSIKSKISMLEFDRQILDLDQKYKPQPDYEYKLSEINEKIRKLEMEKSFQEEVLKEFTGKQSEANKLVEAVLGPISQRNTEIRNVEREVDSLMAKSYENLCTLKGFNPQDGNVGYTKWNFGITSTADLQFGPMVQFDSRYKFHEANRFTDFGLKLSVGIGSKGIKTSDISAKLTQALTFSTSQKFETEIGISEAYNIGNGFMAGGHFGENYKLSPNFDITGGIDIFPQKDVSKIFNPYLGITYKFN